MQNAHALNQLAVWLPMNSKGLDVKVYKEGYGYIEGGIVMRSMMLEPVIRYAKNYTGKAGKYSLCLITKDNNAKKVETWLDNQAKGIKASDITGKFNKLKIYYGQI